MTAKKGFHCLRFTKLRHKSFSSLSGCTLDAAASPCAIPIKHRPFGSSSHFDKVKAWSYHDSFLDWYGVEPLQGKYHGHAAAGTPAVWTTNKAGSAGHSDLNTYVFACYSWISMFKLNDKNICKSNKQAFKKVTFFHKRTTFSLFETFGKSR